MRLSTVLCLVAVVGLSVPAAAADTAPAIGAPAPAFTLADQSGKSVSLADFSGKVVVLEWTNPGCPFVQRHYQAGTMKSLAEKYKDQGVVWLAINSTAGANAEANKKWADEHRLAYPILDDHASEVAQAYQAKTTPDMFIIDKSGNLVYSGAIDDDPAGKNPARINYVRQALDELLAGKPVTTPQTKPYGCSVKYAK